MRIAGRIVGIALAIAGLGFLVISAFAVWSAFHRESVLVEYSPGRAIWIAGSFSAVFGICLLLSSWHLFTLHAKPDEPGARSLSRFAPYFIDHRHFIDHRRELKIIAQTGFVVSLIRLGVACFGGFWPGWTAWPLILAWIVLFVIGVQIAGPQGLDLDWKRIPGWRRPVLKFMLWAGGVTLCILMLLLVWDRWSHTRGYPHALEYGFAPLLFGWEALFFSYGKPRVNLKAA